MSNTSTFTTNNKWEIFSKQLDNFATFMWRGESSTRYHMFVINDKNSLKFYNTPSFSNEYINSKFQNTSQLLGVNYKMPQVLSFKVGIYWFNIEEYQKTLLWLDPSIIDYFNFDFNTEYSYLVKLGSLQETSNRYILGYGEDNKPYYYTELDLKFDLQGENNLRSIVSYEFNRTNIDNTYIWQLNPAGDIQGASIIPSPIIFTWEIEITKASDANVVNILNDLRIIFKAGEKELFMLNFDKITINPTGTRFSLLYDSETGLIFWQNGDNLYLVNLLTEKDDGTYLIKDLKVNKYMLPTDDSSFNALKFTCLVSYSDTQNFNVIINPMSRNLENKDGTLQEKEELDNIIAYKRANVI